MKRLTKKLIVALTLLTVGGFAANVDASDYLRINREARTIERKANLLLRETNHYQATPQYRHLVCDVEDFLRLSQDITDRVRFDGNLNRIARCVNELDRTFFHLEGLFDTIELNIARGFGAKCGNTAHVKRLLNNIEDCIHVMQTDIEILRRRALTCPITHRAMYGTTRTVVETTRYGGYGYGPAVTTRRTTYDRSYHRGYDRSFDRSFDRAYGYGNVGRPVYGGSCPSARGGSGIGFSIGGGSSRINIRF